MSGLSMRILKYELEDDARYQRVKDRPTGKRITEHRQTVKEYREMAKGDVSEDLDNAYLVACETFIEVVRDADERTGSGCMTKSSDRVRHVEKMFNPVREKYDEKYL